MYPKHAQYAKSYPKLASTATHTSHWQARRRLPSDQLTHFFSIAHSLEFDSPPIDTYNHTLKNLVVCNQLQSNKWNTCSKPFPDSGTHVQNTLASSIFFPCLVSDWFRLESAVCWFSPSFHIPWSGDSGLRNHFPIIQPTRYFDCRAVYPLEYVCVTHA